MQAHQQQQVMQQAMMQQAMLSVAKQVEQKIDNEMKAMEAIENDEDALERIRAKRMKELKNMQDKRAVWLRQGHGALNEIGSDKDFFDEAKGSKKLVVHFYRNTTLRCKVLDEHLKVLAKQHIETKFLKLDVDKCDWIVQKLNIRIIPTMALILDGKTTGYLRGFEEFGGTDDFSTEMLEWRLGTAGIITYKGDLKTPPDQRKGLQQGKTSKIERSNQNEARGGCDDDFDTDEEIANW